MATHAGKVYFDIRYRMDKMARILIIDDEKGIRDMISFSLAPYNYTITKAVDGVDGNEQIKSNDYDLILSDMKMPVFDGIMILKSVKSIKPDIEVIIMSGFLDPEAVTNAYRFGLFDFVSKPFDINILHTTVKKALQYRDLKENVLRLCQINPEGSFDLVKKEYLTLVDNSDFPVLTIGERNEIISVNPSALSLLNEQKDVILKKNAQEIFLPLGEPSYRTSLWKKTLNEPVVRDIVVSIGEETKLVYANMSVISLGSGVRSLVLHKVEFKDFYGA